MKERPILYNAPMVRAILADQKTVTRRMIKPQPTLDTDEWVIDAGGTGKWMGSGPSPATGGTRQTWGWATCPYGQPGDRLWVRETWARAGNGDPGYLTYRATYPDCLPPDLENIPPASEIRWKPSIHMFRRDSRILLEVTAVRIERLQDLSEEQARAEGITDGGCNNCGNHEPCGCDCPAPSAIDSFVHLWNSTGGNWDANPWVWVIEFKRITP